MVGLWMIHLLENLAISPIVSLAVDGDWLIPRPLILEESLILWLGWIELDELIAVNIWSDIESWHGLLTTDHESALDDGIVGSAIY